jgi:hypothetical protein
MRKSIAWFASPQASPACPYDSSFKVKVSTQDLWDVTGEKTEPVRHLQARWNVMAQAQKPHFVFRRNGRVHLNQRGRQFSRLLAAEVCASAVVMLDTPCSEVAGRVLATHSIRQFPRHSPPCVTVFHNILPRVYHKPRMDRPGNKPEPVP